MSIEQFDFEVGAETYEGRLNVPEDGDADVGVVMFPGAGHGPFGDVFDVVAYELAGAGAAVLRFESWETREALDGKTLGRLHEELDAAVDRLRAEGPSTVHLLAKSFGGGVALTYVPDAVEHGSTSNRPGADDAVERVLLWEPVIRFGDDPNVDDVTDEPLGDVDLRIGPERLRRVDAPVRILCGDREEASVPVEDCRRLADAVGDGEVVEIPGEDHSFNNNRTAIVEATLAFLAPDA